MWKILNWMSIAMPNAFCAKEENMSVGVCLHFVHGIVLVLNELTIEEHSLKNIGNCLDIKKSFEQNCFVGEDRKCWIKCLLQWSLHSLPGKKICLQMYVSNLFMEWFVGPKSSISDNCRESFEKYQLLLGYQKVF